MSIIQVRGVSARTHRRLKAKARREGKSLAEYLRGELDNLATQPTLDEWLDRVASREPVRGESAAESIRAARAERDRQLDRAVR
jgi:antitoxin FitA